MIARSLIVSSIVTLGLWSVAISCRQVHQTSPSAALLPTSRPSKHESTGRLAESASSPSTRPTLAATQPVELPGLQNIVAYADGVYSGAAPEGEEGFRSLRALGVRTILSVDGAVPDVADAKALGMRYVHLPFGYNGFDQTLALEIARAIRDLPKPIYIHCHHGQHRSAAAAGSAMVTLGMMTPAEAEARLKVSGTALNYTGLYECVRVSRPATDQSLDAASATFPETFRTSGLVQSMVKIDEAADHLKLIERAGWKPAADHPDLVPAAEAGMLAELMRNLVTDEDVAAYPPEFRAWIEREQIAAQNLETALLTGTATTSELSGQFKGILQSCRACHTRYRD